MLLPADQFVLPLDTPRSSKTVINIAGVLVYLYGVQELSPEQASDATVIFHVHGRTRSYKDAEELAHQLLHQLRARSGMKKGFVLATFDNRNHGTRMIDNVATQDWKYGNAHHAQDMLSTIDGTVADVRLVMDFLPSYMTGVFVPAQYIVTGLSLGGHVTWNLLAKDPRVALAVVVVGSPNLKDLLVERVRDSRSNGDLAAEAKMWPKAVEDLYAARDAKVEAISGKKILILNGKEDRLVPSKFTRPWLERGSQTNDVVFIEQDGCGHMLSWGMVDEMEEWIGRNVD